VETLEDLFDRYLARRHECSKAKATRTTKAVQEASYEADRARDRVLGHEDSFGRVRCWMVDVWSKSTCCASQETLSAATDELLQGLPATDRAGSLAQTVREWIESNGFNLTDSGIGCGWHLGAHCTENEAKRLICGLRTRFARALDAGIIYVVRHFWSLSISPQEDDHAEG